MIRALAALLLLALLGDTGPPPILPAARAAGTVALSADTESRWVPFDLTPGNQIRLAMALNGRPVTAILDTGVSYSVLARGSPAVEPARLSASGKATVIGGSVPINWMPTDRLEIGGLTRTGGGVTVTDLPPLATGSTTPIDLLIGRDLVGGQAIDIDFAARRLRLLPTGRLPFTGSIAPLGISPTRRIYESELTLGARRLRPMIVDTGDGASVTVSAAEWRRAALSSLPATTAISYGLVGQVVTELAVVPHLALGQLSAREVEVRVEPDSGFSRTIGAAGRIGTGFLQRYRVLLDPAAGRMVLSPGPTADQPPLRSTSGLLLGYAKDRLKVLHVMRGSPAAAAGWKDGDAICAVDGASIGPDYPDSPAGTWSAGAPGRIVALRLCDGTERRLTLARFY